MAAVTAALIKELRDRTGAGMGDCKKALDAVGGAGVPADALAVSATLHGLHKKEHEPIRVALAAR